MANSAVKAAPKLCGFSRRSWQADNASAMLTASANRKGRKRRGKVRVIQVGVECGVVIIADPIYGYPIYIPYNLVFFSDMSV